MPTTHNYDEILDDVCVALRKNAFFANATLRIEFDFQVRVTLQERWGTRQVRALDEIAEHYGLHYVVDDMNEIVLTLL